MGDDEKEDSGGGGNQRAEPQDGLCVGQEIAENETVFSVVCASGPSHVNPPESCFGRCAELVRG